ncbi:MAG: YHS domain-containing protein [Gemmatimonadetes bacterium]|nr:YHS domain-containing protein [Gemmatimonadota bacterium]
MRHVLIEAIDPVCGLDCTTRGRAGGRFDRPVESAEYQGTLYHFCSEQCRLRFESDPRKYVENAENARSGAANNVASKR